MSPRIQWTDECLASLKELWGGKLSAAQISGELFARHRLTFSRSAVIGKANRLGLVCLKKPTREKKPKKVRVKIVATTSTYKPPRRAVVQAIDDQLIPAVQRKTLLDLTENTCRWPVGHVGEPDFFFCGAEPEPQQPYCAGHCAVAFNHATEPRTSRYRTSVFNLRKAA